MKKLLIFLCLASSSAAFAQEAKETKIIVRTKAKDAKFIGSSMGGSMIMIKDALTGELLAKGLTQGGTGNTQAIMRTPLERYNESFQGAAAFETTLNLSKPVFVDIQALGPVNHESRVMSNTQVWLIPGKHLDEQGVILEMPGFIIDGLFPKTHQGFSIENDQSIEIKANMVMMCGCTISEGGLWDGSQMEVEAHVYVDGVFWKTLQMKNTEENTFISSLQLERTGNHEVIITAFDPRSKNTGADELNFRVSK